MTGKDDDDEIAHLINFSLMILMISWFTLFGFFSKMEYTRLGLLKLHRNHLHWVTLRDEYIKFL